ncbi:hypothetical protein MtrunA17_Chr1g0202081 [Medicago truncatula]|uniref:Transmembrane protein n=1 Tax=Medicago truncatula TaxID=3880 RepID=A0A396K0F7_MEDTR|nr:hypothetical protein MtrunA17_Chr1g0202081 [Medicago truncatula]
MRVRKKISICRYKGGFDDKLYTPREVDSRASKREIKKILHHKEKTLPAHINKQSMENSVKKSNEHSGEEDKERDIQENNNGHMCLAITNCNGETHAKLDEIITHYEGTLNQKISHFLGILFMIFFFLLENFLCCFIRCKLHSLPQYLKITLFYLFYFFLFLNIHFSISTRFL